ncbi:MAG: type II secretion system F family protein [Planctomycetota bacterium]|nr:type II secretion system F family protein [Planctomycetota bacterium]
MAVYAFEALDSKGKKVRREIEAGTKEDAVNKVRNLGLFPTSVKEKGGRVSARSAAAGSSAAAEGKKWVFGRVSQYQLSQFTSQLAILQDAGLPIVKSLKILEGQLKPCKLKNHLMDVWQEVEAGSAFSEALARHPKAFDRLYVNIVKAGETGGVLDVILDRLSSFLEKSVRLKKKVIGALIYPIAVMTIAAMILSVIMIWVIPSFQSMFKEIGVELPTATLFLLAFADIVKSYWFLIPGIPIAAVMTLKLITRTEGGRLFMDRVKLKIPLFGMIIRKSTIARFSRTLGTLIASGVPILDALAIVKESIGNRVVADAIDNVHGSIREGESIAGPLAQSHVFDAIIVNMIEVGEETGELDKMLLKISDNYDNDVDVAVESMTSLLEPILIVGMGLVVGFIVISLFLPLVSLIEQL